MKNKWGNQDEGKIKFFGVRADIDPSDPLSTLLHPAVCSGNWLVWPVSRFSVGLAMGMTSRRSEGEQGEVSLGRLRPSMGDTSPLKVTFLTRLSASRQVTALSLRRRAEKPHSYWPLVTVFLFPPAHTSVSSPTVNKACLNYTNFSGPSVSC